MRMGREDEVLQCGGSKALSLVGWGESRTFLCRGRAGTEFEGLGVPAAVAGEGGAETLGVAAGRDPQAAGP